MTRRILFSGAFILMAMLWGCSDQQNGVSPMSDPSTGGNNNGEVTNVDPELQALILEAANTEDGAFDFTQSAAKYSNMNRTYIDGPTTITEPGLYVVSSDFAASDDAIVIESDWVFLFIGQKSITGPGNKSGHGIIVDGAEHVAVVGGRLSMFGIGVAAFDSPELVVRNVKITGGDVFANPAGGVAPQIGIMMVNSSDCLIYRNDISMINLGIFIRGDGSYDNRVFANTLTGGDLGLLGICYNPDGSGDPAGPHDDRVYNNQIDRFRMGLQVSAGGHENSFYGNDMTYFVQEYEDVDGLSRFSSNDAIMIPAPMSPLDLNFTGLEDLGPDYAYEGWLIVNGAPVSTGVFTVDGSGMPSQTTFDVYSFNLEAATKFVLTIEPSPDPDPAPSHTHYLAGDFMSGNASLSVANAAALGHDFTGAMGDYILNTPSTGSDDTDYANGIWWLDPSGGTHTPTLHLPELPEGWIYEGWVVGPGGPVTTGKFMDPAMVDMDGAGPTSGPDGFPPFPGQDYINPPMPLIGYAAVISIEPYPDNSDAPFALKPLVDGMIDDVGIGVLQSMDNNASSFPAGSAMR